VEIAQDDRLAGRSTFGESTVFVGGAAQGTDNPRVHGNRGSKVPVLENGQMLSFFLVHFMVMAYQITLTDFDH